MSKKDQEYASFDPDDHTSGGYLDDKDCVIIASQIVEFDFNGKADAPMCCWMVTYRPDGGDPEGEDDRTEYYRIGPLTKFTPSGDNTRAVAVTAGAKMNNKSKASIFARSLKEAGVAVTNDVSILADLRVHVNVLPMPKFTGKDGVEVKDASVTAVTAVLDGEAPAAAVKAKGGATKAKAAPKAAAKAAKAAAAGDDAEEAAAGLIMTALAEGEGKTTKIALPNAAFKAFKSDSNLRNAVIKLVANDDWLGAEDRPWAYEGGELSLG